MNIPDYFHEMASGAGHARGIVQPLLATVLGVYHGLRDARRGRGPFVSELRRQPGPRRDKLKAALRPVMLPLAAAITLSLLFQSIVRQEVHLIPALVFAALFVALPYLLARGVAARAGRALSSRSTTRTTPTTPAPTTP